MEALMGLAIGLATVNAIILLALIYLYARIALRTRAAFSVGLLIFGGLLLFQNLLTAIAYGAMWPFFGSEALPYLSAMGGAELAGLIVLLRITV
jgi:hypothetical protein